MQPTAAPPTIGIGPRAATSSSHAAWASCRPPTNATASPGGSPSIRASAAAAACATALRVSDDWAKPVPFTSAISKAGSIDAWISEKPGIPVSCRSLSLSDKARIAIPWTETTRSQYGRGPCRCASDTTAPAPARRLARPLRPDLPAPHRVIGLARLLVRVHAHNQNLLTALDRPEMPLHTKGSERDLRPQGIQRKISSDARDAFL